jgi:hypothetical protein
MARSHEKVEARCVPACLNYRSALVSQVYGYGRMEFNLNRFRPAEKNLAVDLIQFGGGISYV